MQAKMPQADADVGRRTLCLAIDETGHEEFKSTERFFAFGGVAGLGPQLELARQRWRKMKERYFGGAEMPLHASGKMLSREQIDALSRFFESTRLYRFAFIIKKPPIVPANLNALKLLREIMLQELGVAICNLPTLPTDVVLCFEHSERMTPKVVEALPNLSTTIDGTVIPAVGVFSPKLPPEPLLEMADQVAWRAQRQYREYNPRRALMPEFVSVFPEKASHATYREVRVGVVSGGVEPRWHLEFNDQDLIRLRLEGGSRPDDTSGT